MQRLMLLLAIFLLGTTPVLQAAVQSEPIQMTSRGSLKIGGNSFYRPLL
ncbi:MAG: hypothetical protein L6W00_26865 [Lentisphaeria bacterium]|nr:MAG: hypothetical protein L6W00_26865 [Lentisphaeria bacterium]